MFPLFPQRGRSRRGWMTKPRLQLRVDEIVPTSCAFFCSCAFSEVQSGNKSNMENGARICWGMGPVKIRHRRWISTKALVEITAERHQSQEAPCGNRTSSGIGCEGTGGCSKLGARSFKYLTRWYHIHFKFNLCKRRVVWEFWGVIPLHKWVDSVIAGMNNCIMYCSMNLCFFIWNSQMYQHEDATWKERVFFSLWPWDYKSALET